MRSSARSTTITTAYTRLIRWVLAHRKTTLALALGLLLASFALVPVIGAEFMPKTDAVEYYSARHQARSTHRQRRLRGHAKYTLPEIAGNPVARLPAACSAGRPAEPASISKAGTTASPLMPLNTFGMETSTACSSICNFSSTWQEQNSR